MRCFSLWALALGALFLTHVPANAFTFSDGSSLSCIDYRGVAAAETAQPMVSVFGQTVAAATMAGSGPAPSVMTFSTVLVPQLPPAAHDFLFFHECAHARLPTSDELVANCRGLIDMRNSGRANTAVENQLASFHASLGFMGPRYGVGTVYWANTVACANGPSPPAPSVVAGSTTLCRFSYGPRNGQITDFAGQAGVIPIPTGAPCGDGAGSFGTAVANASVFPGAAVIPPPSAPSGVTMKCRFNYGPLAGQTFDFSHTPGATPAFIGGPCHAGFNVGVGVP